MREGIAVRAGRRRHRTQDIPQKWSPLAGERARGLQVVVSEEEAWGCHILREESHLSNSWTVAGMF